MALYMLWYYRVIKVEATRAVANFDTHVKIKPRASLTLHPVSNSVANNAPCIGVVHLLRKRISEPHPQKRVTASLPRLI